MLGGLGETESLTRCWSECKTGHLLWKTFWLKIKHETTK